VSPSPAPRALRCGLLALAALQLLAGRGLAQAAYSWTDPDGTRHWSDLPPPKAETQSKAEAPPRPTPASAPVQKPAPAEPVLRHVELPYVANEGHARRVIVQVRFNDRLTAPMALDTGAPGMVISFGLAQQLDLFSRDQGKLIVLAGGIGGQTPAIRTILDTVTIGGVVEKFVPVTITNKVSDAFEGLVGMDFMGEYSMTIDPARKLVLLQEQPSAEGSPGGHDESWWRHNFAEFREARDGWRRYQELVDRALADSQQAGGLTHEELLEERALAAFQVQEAETLVARLERYASTQAVPRHWR
jgi:Aspartyl protease/Domain of unknown function (DUF4124)